MTAFFVGLAVIILMTLVWVAGVFLLPLILLLGFFLRFILATLLILFTIWLIGKLTLLLIETLKRKSS